MPQIKLGILKTGLPAQQLKAFFVLTSFRGRFKQTCKLPGVQKGWTTANNRKRKQRQTMRRCLATQRCCFWTHHQNHRSRNPDTFPHQTPTSTFASSSSIRIDIQAEGADLHNCKHSQRPNSIEYVLKANNGGVQVLHPSLRRGTTGRPAPVKQPPRKTSAPPWDAPALALVGRREAWRRSK